MTETTKDYQKQRNGYIAEALRLMISDLFNMEAGVIIEPVENSNDISITLLEADDSPTGQVSDNQAALNEFMDDLSKIDSEVTTSVSENNGTTRKLTANAGELIEPLHITLARGDFSEDAFNAASRLLIAARAAQDYSVMTARRDAKTAQQRPLLQ